MAVKLELYRVFRTVAEKGSVSAAAQELFISQSAVSQSIRQLEDQLQIRLFRARRAASPSRARASCCWNTSSAA